MAIALIGTWPPVARLRPATSRWPRQLNNGGSLFRLPFPCTEKAAAGSGPAAAFRALGGAGVVGVVVLRVAEFDCVLQLVDPRVGEVGDLRDRQKVIAAECGSAIPVGAAAEKAGDMGRCRTRLRPWGVFCQMVAVILPTRISATGLPLVLFAISFLLSVVGVIALPLM